LVESEAVGFHYECREQEVLIPPNTDAEGTEKKESGLNGRPGMAQAGEGSQEPLLTDVPEEEAEVQEEAVDIQDTPEEESALQEDDVAGHQEDGCSDVTTGRS